MKRLCSSRLVGGFAALGGLLYAYLRWIRPWQLRWGATDRELDRLMPGDDVVTRPAFDATRAVTVRAQPEHIWPWLVQIGFRRAGWYSYDWVDNLGVPSAETILPEFQRIEVGTFVPLGPGDESGFWVRAFEINRWVLWVDKKGGVSWCWGLYPDGEGNTRLVSRVRMRYAWTSPAIIFHLLLDVGDIVMMRKCMLGIKRRAEALAAAEAH